MDSGIDAKSELKGVAGWLKVLVIYLKYLYPLVSLLNALNSTKSTPPDLLVASTWMTIACIVASFALGNQLQKNHTWKSVRIVFHALWILPTVNLIFMFSLLSDYMVQSEFNWVGIVGVLFWSYLWPTVWMLYLMRSKRVRNTYIKI